MAFSGTIVNEIAARVELSTESSEPIDIAGFTNIKCRLQLGAADEFTISLPAQDIEGVWRADMPIWQVGGTIRFSVGYDGRVEPVQHFEIVSTTVNYPEGATGEMMTVRAVSDLVRAARNRKARSFGANSTYLDIITEICNDYGWINDVPSNDRTSTTLSRGDDLLAKKAGDTDLTYLKNVSKRVRLGAPTLTNDLRLRMPEPDVGPLTFTRGVSSDENSRRLLSLNMNRDGGQSTRVVILTHDPTAPENERFIEKVFEASEFGGDPDIVYEGPKSTQALDVETSNYNLALAVVEHRGYGKDERVDVISTSQFKTDLSAEELATIWFQFREQFGRWATATVEGNIGLSPYVSVKFDGNLASVDKSADWLPMWVEHDISAGGWVSRMRVVRVVEEPPPLQAVE